MTENADLLIRLKANTEDAKAKFEALKKQTQKMNVDFNAVGKASGIAFAAITAGIGFSVKQAMEAESVDARLIQTLKNLGFESKKASKEMSDMASSIQRASRFGDEDLKDVMTALIDYTKDYNVTLQHTQTVADLAAAKKIDLATATKLVGQAFQGSTGMLLRYGVVLEDGAKGMDALQQLSTRFAGAAAADANTAAGAYEQFKNAVGDMGESLGKAFIPAVTEATQKITGLVNKFSDFNEKTGGGASKVLAYSAGITGLVAGVSFIIPKLATAATGFKMLTAAMAANPVIAAAVGFGLLANALTDVAVHMQEVNNEKIKNSVNTETMIKNTEKEIASIENYMSKIDEQYRKSEIYLQKEKELQTAKNKLMGLTALSGNHKPTGTGDTGGGGGTDSPVSALEPELQASLESMGILTDSFTEAQIEKYNNMYMSRDEMDEAYMEGYIQKIQETNRTELEENLRTKEELAAIDAQKNAQRLAATSDMFGNLSSLMMSESRNMFEIGKAAAVAQAVIDTYSSAQSAFASLSGIPVVGPALGIAAAAAAVTAGVMRVNQISSTSFNPKGAQEGVMGGFNEPLITTLKPQEIVVPQKFSEGIRRGEMALTGAGAGTGTTLQVIFQGDIYGVPKDEFMTNMSQKINELIQSGSISARNFTGATS